MTLRTLRTLTLLVLLTLMPFAFCVVFTIATLAGITITSAVIAGELVFHV